VPLIGICSQGKPTRCQTTDRPLTAFPVAQPMITAVLALLTFRRLPASETQKERGQAGS